MKSSGPGGKLGVTIKTRAPDNFTDAPSLLVGTARFELTTSRTPSELHKLDRDGYETFRPVNTGCYSNRLCNRNVSNGCKTTI